MIYGSIRDADELGAMDLGVQALATYPMKTEKKGIGNADIPVTFAGVTIHPGVFISSDNNRIVVSPVALDAKKTHIEDIKTPDTYFAEVFFPYV